MFSSMSVNTHIDLYDHPKHGELKEMTASHLKTHGMISFVGFSVGTEESMRSRDHVKLWKGLGLWGLKPSIQTRRTLLVCHEAS